MNNTKTSGIPNLQNPYNWKFALTGQDTGFANPAEDLALKRKRQKPFGSWRSHH
jgi:hypothetical protein